MIHFAGVSVCVLALLAGSAQGAVDRADAPTASIGSELCWHSDYREAYQEAEQQGKMLLIHFVAAQGGASGDERLRDHLNKHEILASLKSYVLARLPVDATIQLDGEPLRLLNHASFAEMHGAAGLAIVDLKNDQHDYYGHVVSAFPMTGGNRYDLASISTILDLPGGTLTQRTMIYAVRMHPERPRSTSGEFHSVLAEEAEQHSRHQASIRLQGHHNWETRFHRINRRIGSGASATEVVAESWSGQDLVEAAVECVHSWRQSPGHWRAVRGRHRLFGYDIKRGSNGTWYATGIFASRFR